MNVIKLNLNPKYPDYLPIEWCTDDCKTAKLIYKSDNGAIYKTECNRTFIVDDNGINELIY
jgi:hypothetical protein